MTTARRISMALIRDGPNPYPNPMSFTGGHRMVGEGPEDALRAPSKDYTSHGRQDPTWVLHATIDGLVPKNKLSSTNSIY